MVSLGRKDSVEGPKDESLIPTLDVSGTAVYQIKSLTESLQYLYFTRVGGTRGTIKGY